MKQIEKDYFVDELGNVWSNKNNSLKLLKGRFDKAGYLLVNLSNKKPINKKVHRLVAQAFIENPNNKPLVNHKNGIKTDNRVENLEWCTAKENVKHAFNLGLMKVGSDRMQSKLTDSQIIQIRLDKRIQRIIALDYGVDQALISRIKSRKIWNHI